jgi:methanogenic corrinoid protein MtbC1
VAIKTLAERKTAKLEELEKIKRELARLETQEAERIGKLAIRAGLSDLDLSEDTLAKEFAVIAKKHQSKSPIKGDKTAHADALPPSEG